LLARCICVKACKQQLQQCCLKLCCCSVFKTLDCRNHKVGNTYEHLYTDLLLTTKRQIHTSGL
jgi:hypothetical protein